MAGLIALRLAPVVLVAVATGVWFADVQAYGPYVGRNLLPLAILVGICALILGRGRGRWTGAGWRFPLGALGYAIPALGLAAYLHYAYAVNLGAMFGDPPDPGQLFRFLPLYTIVAGGIGFAIGWIAGRNL